MNLKQDIQTIDKSLNKLFSDVIVERFKNKNIEVNFYNTN